MKENLITAQEIVAELKKEYNIKDNYEIAFIMGSGLDGAVPEFENKIEIDYKNTKMPKSKVVGFTGKFVFGTINGMDVMKITRYHYYENGDVKLVMLPFEIMNLLGVKTVMLATATGGVDQKFDVGTLMLIEDHINLTGFSPLIGRDKIEFIDLNNAYDPALRLLAIESAKKVGVQLERGTHMQFSGPTYETPAEVVMARIMGAKTVSMSTAFDTICARNFGIKVLAFASVVNKAGVVEEEITHDMVLEASRINAIKLKKILLEILR
jgi:purine-nucleoside phosphorylase